MKPSAEHLQEALSAPKTGRDLADVISSLIEMSPHPMGMGVGFSERQIKMLAEKAGEWLAAAEAPSDLTESQVQEWCERIYRETGGVTPALRRAYEFYKAHAEPSEIEPLERALAEKDAEIERLNKALADICAESVRRLKRAAEAESALKNAREKAIEECAKICDGVVRALSIFEPATAQWEHARQAEELTNAIRSLLPHPDTGEG